MEKEDKFEINLILYNWVGGLGIVVLCLLSRLPQILSPYFHADFNGDECILGLMANHMLHGQEFPFYFWGQSYGFSWIEAGGIALAIKLIGYSVFSLKVPMLMLWTIGVVFFYSALSIWTNKIYGFLIACLLIFSPAWMDWSMKARSGYITAFLLTSLVLFLIAYHGKKIGGVTLFFIGILSGFIFYAQPIYLVGLFPLLIYVFFLKIKIKDILVWLIGFGVIYGLGKWMAFVQGNTDFWQPVWFRPDNFLLYFSTFQNRIFDALNQNSSLFSLSGLLSKFWFNILLASIVLYVYSFIIKRINILSTIFLISITLILASTLCVNTEIRYLLSFNVFLILWFGILSFEWFKKNLFFRILCVALISFLIILGMMLAWNYQDFYRLKPKGTNEVPEMQKISKVIEFLSTSHVKYVFALDDDLSWKLMFFSGEKIISRGSGMFCRQPKYNKSVSLAFLKGEKVALVGNLYAETFAYMGISQYGKPEIIANQYFVLINPSYELMANELGFGFDTSS